MGACPSSNHLRLVGGLCNGVSGPSEVKVKLRFGGASSGNAIQLLYTRDPANAADVDVQARMFSPLDGIVQDPAAGSALAGTMAVLVDVLGVMRLALSVRQGVDKGSSGHGRTRRASIGHDSLRSLRAGDGRPHPGARRCFGRDAVKG